MKVFPLAVVVVFLFVSGICVRAQSSGVAMRESPTVAAPQPSNTWIGRHQLLLDRTRKAQGHVDLIFVGDSITQNYEKTGPAPDEVFAPIWEQFYGDRNALNLGVSGDQTQNVLWRLEHGEVDGLSPKVVVVLIGTNNSGHHPEWPAEGNTAGIEAVVSELHARLPGAKILLLGILPSGISQKKIQIDTTVNSQISAKYAGSSFVTYLDIGRIFFMPGGGLNTALFYDTRFTPPSGALHPDTVGQRMMAEAIEPTLARLLGDKSKADSTKTTP